MMCRKHAFQGWLVPTECVLFLSGCCRGSGWEKRNWLGSRVFEIALRSDAQKIQVLQDITVCCRQLSMKDKLLKVCRQQAVSIDEVEGKQPQAV